MDEEYLSQGLTQPAEDRVDYEMPLKRKYPRKSYASAKRFKRGYRGKSKNYGRRVKGKFAKAVMRAVNRNAEVKSQMVLWRDNMTLWHNNVENICNNAFQLPLGLRGDGIATTNGCRVGKRIFVKGIKVSMNLESQQYRPQVNFWLYLVRDRVNVNASITTKAQMFEGVTTTIPCDYIDKEKCDIMFCKKFVLKMPNSGTNQPMKQDATGVAENGFAYKTAEGPLGVNDWEVFTNPQLCKKFYVPINRNLYFRDEDDVADTPIGSQRYQWVIIPYDNFTSSSVIPATAGYPAGHITFSTKVLFTDV